MADEDLSAELLGFQLSDSDGEDADADANPGVGTGAEPDKAARTAQSEEAFQAVKRTYRVKVENGEIWRTIKLPLPTDIAVTKPGAQALLHAVEELYFFQRYAEGAAFVRRVLSSDNNRDSNGDSATVDEDGDGTTAAPALDEDTRKTLRYYEMRCMQRQQGAGVMTADANTNTVT
ncbi:hypothetical protein SLS62_006172 [Diatrype stigma]|uniref:Uncharacterized protein n=1 Tax=Diatrype stigma TaxID=117547 RepID=A0AAN9UPX1_9PEZI